MRLTLDGDWNATVTGDPLRITPRFDFPGQCVRIAEYADVERWQRFLTDTFGSHAWLWDDPDELRFAPDTRELAGAGFRLPYESPTAEDHARAPATPPVHPGGLRADEARDREGPGHSSGSSDPNAHPLRSPFIRDHAAA
ncbi:hypothetical protein LIX60_14135 [Streptomyces sp. S07_1.15]|uniref:hypothetical protein n=1 Tax=Streptomyces sp. S07_1.15 TaxID=2873925 RepID=UPI001D13A4F1|nr:hypothetical protein [Streptomyces sp. S07_1.15]MCC3652587.1 hypothetical protein [Streptomyces sp. S07_1.15]